MSLIGSRNSQVAFCSFFHTTSLSLSTFVHFDALFLNLLFVRTSFLFLFLTFYFSIHLALHPLLLPLSPPLLIHSYIFTSTLTLPLLSFSLIHIHTMTDQHAQHYTAIKDVVLTDFLDKEPETTFKASDIWKDQPAIVVGNLTYSHDRLYICSRQD